MADNQTKQLYYYLSNPWTKIEKALLDMANLSLTGLEKGDPKNKIKNIVENIMTEYLMSSEKAEDIFLNCYNKSVIGLLDLNLISGFLSRNQNADGIDLLNKQLVLISIALGVNTEFKELLPEEFKEIALSGKSDFNIVDLIGTTRLSMFTLVAREYLPFMLNLLEFDDMKEAKLYTFEDTLLLVMFLYDIWSQYDFLNNYQKLYLLQSYFYKSIAIGVPMENALAVKPEQSDNQGQYKKHCQFLARALDTNIEDVITDISGEETKKFNEILDKYLLRFQDARGGIELNKFVEELYSGQQGRDAFVSWLREAIYIDLEARKGAGL